MASLVNLGILQKIDFNLVKQMTTWQVLTLNGPLLTNYHFKLTLTAAAQKEKQANFRTLNVALGGIRTQDLSSIACNL